MISGLVGQILLFLLAAAIVGFLFGWFLGRQREAELSQELLKQRGLEERLTVRITQLLDGLERPFGPGDLKALEAQVGSRAGQAEVVALKEELALVRGALDGLRSAEGTLEEKLLSLPGGVLKPLEHRLETLGSEVQRSLTPDFAWVKEDVGGVKRDVAELRAVVDGLQGGQHGQEGQDDVVARPRSGGEPLVDLGPLQAEVRRLADGLEALRKGWPATGVEVAALHVRFDELQAAVDSPISGLAAIRDGVAGVQGAGAGSPPDLEGVEQRLAKLWAELEDVRGALEAVNTGQAELATKLAVDLASLVEERHGGPSLEERLAELRQSVDALRGTSDGASGAWGERLEALSRGLESLGASLQLGPLEAGVRRLDEKVESLAASVQLGSLEAGVQRLDEKVEVLRGALATTPELDLGPLEDRWSQLVEHVEALRDAVGRPPVVDFSPLEEKVEALASRVEAVGHSPEVDLTPLLERVEALASSVEALRGATGREASSWAARLDRLSSDLESLRAPHPLGPLEERVRRLDEGVASLLDVLREAPAAPVTPLVELTALEGCVKRLDETVASLREATGKTPELDLSPLVERLDALATGVASLRSTAPPLASTDLPASSRPAPHPGASPSPPAEVPLAHPGSPETPRGLEAAVRSVPKASKKAKARRGSPG